MPHWGQLHVAPCASWFHVVAAIGMPVKTHESLCWVCQHHSNNHHLPLLGKKGLKSKGKVSLENLPCQAIGKSLGQMRWVWLCHLCHWFVRLGIQPALAQSEMTSACPGATSTWSHNTMLGGCHGLPDPNPKNAGWFFPSRTILAIITCGNEGLLGHLLRQCPDLGQAPNDSPMDSPCQL